jgi:hypothetical protein
MLKKVVEKRIAQFKKDFPKYKVSKKGNLYYSHNEVFSKMGMVYNVFNVTKGTIDKIGEGKEWEKSSSDFTVLITQKGKLMVRHRKKTTFKLVTMKDVRKVPKLTDCFLIGRKFEYLSQYPKLMDYNFFQGFNSLKEAKLFLGYGFISDVDFYSLFPDTKKYGFYCDTTTFKYILQTPPKFKSNLVTLLKKSSVERKTLYNMVEDYHRMCTSLGEEKVIPRSFNRLKELHDNAVLKINLGKAEKYSDEVEASIESIREDGATFEDYWEVLDIKFSKLDSQRKMFLEGIKQKHCIGSYSDSLDTYSFYRIYYNNQVYNIQITPSGKIKQFYGYLNCQPPKELRELIHDKGIDYAHKIKHKNNDMLRAGTDVYGGPNTMLWYDGVRLRDSNITDLAFQSSAIPNVELILERDFRQLTALDSTKIYVVQNPDGSVHSIMNGSQEICPTSTTVDRDEGIDSVWL